MFRKLPSGAWPARKPVPHITQVLKFGTTGRMTLNATFGPWGALYMRWPRLGRRLGPII